MPYRVISIIMVGMACWAVTAGAQTTVSLNGKPVSGDVKTIGGKPYVSLDDMARAMGMVLVRKGNGYQIVAAGGAHETRSRYTGKVGDDIFTGDWRFTVRDVSEAAQYTTRFDGTNTGVTPKGDGSKLVIVTCRLKNGHPVKENIQFRNAIGKSDHASLTDSDEHAYEPLYCDVKLTYYNYGAHILPGAANDFAMIFSVPRNVKPKDLIYRIFRYEDAGTDKKHTIVRVTLTK